MLDFHAAQTMLDLGIPSEQIGSSDHDKGIQHAAFMPHDRNGGSIGTGSRITLDSGVMNLELLTANYGEEAGRLWASSRLRDRMQAIGVHEKAEGECGTHEEALARAPQTELPVSHRAREILRAMERGWKL